MSGDPNFTEPQHIPGMAAWLFEYDTPDGVYGIVLHGADPQEIIAEHCDTLSGLRLLGLHGGTVTAQPEGGDAMIAASQPAQPVAVKVKPLVWGGGVFFGQPAHFADIEFGRLTVVDHRMQGKGIKAYDTAGDSIGVFDDADAAKAALEADYEARIMAEVDVQPLTVQDAQCCMCGKRGLSTAEDGGPECELSDGRWVCSRLCYSRAMDGVSVQDAARKLLDAVKDGLDPLDASYPEIEALAVKHAGNMGDGVIQLEIAEEFFKAALRAIAEGRA